MTAYGRVSLCLLAFGTGTLAVSAVAEEAEPASSKTESTAHADFEETIIVASRVPTPAQAALPARSRWTT